MKNMPCHMLRFNITTALAFLFLPLFAQEEMSITHSCNFASGDTLMDIYTYEASGEAQDIVAKILQANVLPQNFIIKSADCNNALATTVGRQRYILYSTSFLENFKKDARTKWASYCVLAHEIGHHLSNHDLEETDPKIRRRYELEADRFAGGIMYRLGATLDEAQAGINTFSLENASSTHPPKRARLEAVAVGWKQAEELADQASSPMGQVSKDSDEKKLFDKAVAEKNDEKAMELLDQVIEMKEDYADAYLERGKRRLNNYSPEDIRPRFNLQEILEDFNTYILMRPKNSTAFSSRAQVYLGLGRDSAALADCNHAIRLDNKNAEAYFVRSIVKRNDNDFDAAIKDLTKSTQLQPDFAEAWYWLGNTHYWIGENEKAIAALDQALKADPTFREAMDLRAGAKQQLKRYDEALLDYNRLEALDPDKFEQQFDRGLCLQATGKYREAIADYDKLLLKYPESGEAYLRRGVSKQVLGKKEDAWKDYVRAFENVTFASDYKLLDYACQIGCLLLEAGQQEGSDWIRSVLAEYPENEKALECRSEGRETVPDAMSRPYFRVMRDYAKALYEAKEHPGNPDNHFSLSYYALFVGEYDKAIAAARKTLAMKPSDVAVESNLAFAYLLSNQFGPAEEIFKKWKGKKFAPEDQENANVLFLKDLADLEAAGIQHPDFAKVRALLK